MIAVVSDKYGPPEVQKIIEIEKPKPNSHEVLVKIYATTVNRTDCGMRSAQYFISRLFTGIFKPKFKVFGSEFAGKVVAVGKEVKEFKIDDKVFGFDDVSFGAHAEYKVIPSSSTISTIPKYMTYVEAAPITEGALYAYNDIEAANVKKNHNVLIYGASGAIGSSAIQIIKHIGAKVTAVCGTKNVNLLKSLGADRVIDYKKEDFTQIDQQFDFIFDAVGKSSYGQCKKLLKPTGIYCSTELGFMCQNPLLAMWYSLIGSRRVIFPIPQSNKEKIEYLKNLIESGSYKPHVDRIYQLKDIIEATRYVETGKKVGNVVIQVR